MPWCSSSLSTQARVRDGPRKMLQEAVYQNITNVFILVQVLAQVLSSVLTGNMWRMTFRWQLAVGLLCSIVHGQIRILSPEWLIRTFKEQGGGIQGTTATFMMHINTNDATTKRNKNKNPINYFSLHSNFSRSSRVCSDMFSFVWMRSDALRCIQMHLDAFGGVWIFLEIWEFCFFNFPGGQLVF